MLPIHPDVLMIVRRILGIVLDMVPVPYLHSLLDEEARARANRIADLAEEAKFGPRRY